MLFLLFCVVFNSFCTIYVVIENAKLKLAIVIPTGAPKTLAKEVIGTPLLVVDKTIIKINYQL